VLADRGEVPGTMAERPSVLLFGDGVATAAKRPDGAATDMPASRCEHA
jgi:hypothetical protein